MAGTEAEAGRDEGVGVGVEETGREGSDMVEDEESEPESDGGDGWVAGGKEDDEIESLSLSSDGGDGPA